MVISSACELCAGPLFYAACPILPQLDVWMYQEWLGLSCLRFVYSKIHQGIREWQQALNPGVLKSSVEMSSPPHSGLLEHRNHPDEPGQPAGGQAHLSDLCRHSRWELEGPPRPQELRHQLPVQPGETAPWTGPPGGQEHLEMKPWW